MCFQEESHIYILNEEHSHRDTLPRWRGSILLVKPSKGLIRSTFNKAAKKQHNLFGLLHSTFNFLLSLICSCRHLSIFNPLPSLLSLKGTFIEMLSRTSSHTRPDYNRPTYLPGSFIYLLPPPSLLALDWSSTCTMTAASWALALQMKKMKKKWSFFFFSAGEATSPQSAVNQISFLVIGSLSAVGCGAASRETRRQPRG